MYLENFNTEPSQSFTLRITAIDDDQMNNLRSLAEDHAVDCDFEGLELECYDQEELYDFVEDVYRNFNVCESNLDSEFDGETLYQILTIGLDDEGKFDNAKDTSKHAHLTNRINYLEGQIAKTKEDGFKVPDWRDVSKEELVKELREQLKDVYASMEELEKKVKSE